MKAGNPVFLKQLRKPALTELPPLAVHHEPRAHSGEPGLSDVCPEVLE